MAFDGLITKLISIELNEQLKNGKVNKIYEPNKNELLIDIYNKKRFLLNICIDSSNCRINLTTHPKENPINSPNFCMLLRKYLIGSKITSIDTYNLDRIVLLSLENYNELNDLVSYKLVIELMGKHSNVILINKNNIIIDSLRHISSDNAIRTILPANIYTFPESNKINICHTNFDIFKNTVYEHTDSPLASIIQNSFEGINSSFIKYTIDLLHINETSFNDNDLEKLYNYLLSIISNKNIEIINIDLKNKKDYIIRFNPSNLTSQDINSFIDEFYYEKETFDTILNYKNNLLKIVSSLYDKYNKKIITINKKILDCNNMEQYRLYGELITSNLYKINNNINISNISLENYYDNNNLIEIPLDIKYSPSYNAKLYFKKYNKLKNTLEIVSKQKIEFTSEINYLDDIKYFIENSKNITELKEIKEEIESEYKIINNISKSKLNKSIESKIEHIAINEFNVFIGKNNTQNDIVTFKLSDKNDIWFHVQDYSGSHVLLKTNNKEITDTNSVLLECAKIAASNSKASCNSKVLVDYTLIKNIKKPKNSKPGFVTFNNYKTIIVDLNKNK